MGHELREFVDRVMDHRAIDDQDVKVLQREILNDTVVTRDIVDILIALDRAVSKSCDAFADYLVALVVDFAVWDNRPTGVIDRDKAHWLVTTLSAGEGPSPTARRIAFEVVREAEHCDELLLSFAFAKGAANGAGAGHRVLLAN
jgi:acetyl-CoA carboxylase alpha subunit